jgi:hypothetical protein
LGRIREGSSQHKKGTRRLTNDQGLQEFEKRFEKIQFGRIMAANDAKFHVGIVWLAHR